MLILQKERSQAAQHQQLILCKSSFPHLELLFYAAEAHKWRQVKVEILNLKEFLHMFGRKMHLRIFFCFFLMCGKGRTLDGIFNWLNGNLDEQEVENPQKQTESTNANGTGRLETPVAWHVSLTFQYCPLGFAWHRVIAFPSEHY